MSAELESASLSPPRSFTDTEKSETIASQSNSFAVTNEHETTHAVLTKELCSKLDAHLLTPVFLLNFLSLMGRTNIGAALIQGLPFNLHLDSTKVFVVVVMPITMLIVCEVPSNLLMKWLEKKVNLSYMRYLSLITVGLGLVTMGQAFVQTYEAILGTRFLVGIFDAGLIPGSVFLLSLYYPARHMQWRMSMIMVANICSNILSNILAYIIAKIHNSNGWLGWRWIFLVEGSVTVFIGLLCCASSVSLPLKSPWLNAKEKEVLDRVVESRGSTMSLVAEWRAALSNIINYVCAILYVLTCSTTYSVAIFSPSLIKEIHPDWDTPKVQGHVVPVFVVSAVICLLTAFLADRYNHRLGFAIGGYIVTAAGYCVLRYQEQLRPQILMMGLYLVSVGTYTSLPMVWTLQSLNSPTQLQKAIGSGLVVGLGNVAGFVSAWIFRSTDIAHFAKGMTDCLILTCAALGVAASTWLYIERANRRSAQNKLYD